MVVHGREVEACVPQCATSHDLAPRAEVPDNMPSAWWTANISYHEQPNSTAWHHRTSPELSELLPPLGEEAQSTGTRYTCTIEPFRNRHYPAFHGGHARTHGRMDTLAVLRGCCSTPPMHQHWINTEWSTDALSSSARHTAMPVRKLALQFVQHSAGPPRVEQTTPSTQSGFSAE